jgi:hypothetical protein
MSSLEQLAHIRLCEVPTWHFSPGLGDPDSIRRRIHQIKNATEVTFLIW